MDVPTILAELSREDEFPSAALLAARKRRAEMVPAIIAEIEAWLGRDSVGRRQPTPLFYAFHLLGEWRATEAYGPVCRLLRADAEDVDDLLGDAMLETLPSVMAGLFDGDPEPLFSVIRDGAASQYARGSLFETLAILGRDGRLDRQVIHAFLDECLAGLQPRGRSHVWHGVAEAVAGLGFADLKNAVKKLIAADFIDANMLDAEYFELDFEAWQNAPPGGLDDMHLHWAPFDDAVEQLETWYGRRKYEPEDSEPEEDEGDEDKLAALPRSASPESVVNPLPTDVATILAELSREEVFPRQALVAAGEQREEVAPALIAAIERYIAADAAGREEPNPLFFGIHLLAEWQVTEAYRPVCHLVRLSSDDVHDLLGDALTVTLGGVLAKLFDGDPEPIFDLVRDAAADMFVRNAALDALSILVLDGRLERERVQAFVEECLQSMRPRAESYVWIGVADIVAHLQLRSLEADVVRLFEDGWIDPGFTDVKWFRRDMEAWRDPVKAQAETNDLRRFETAIGEFEKWPMARDEAEDERGGVAGEAPAGWSALGETIVNPFRNVGRNDPCPCGSGKKFKKCCYGRQDDLAAELAARPYRPGA